MRIHLFDANATAWGGTGVGAADAEGPTLRDGGAETGGRLQECPRLEGAAAQ